MKLVITGISIQMRPAGGGIDGNHWLAAGQSIRTTAKPKNGAAQTTNTPLKRCPRRNSSPLARAARDRMTTSAGRQRVAVTYQKSGALRRNSLAKLPSRAHPAATAKFAARRQRETTIERLPSRL